MRTSKLICTDLKWVCESFFCVFKYMLPGKSLAQTAWNAGQERVLWEKQRFVRNRHFSNGPFTGKFPVFQFCPLRLRCFSEDNRVEYFSDFSGFCSTFGSACLDFGGSGRQKSSTSPIFCLLLDPHALNLEGQVDKNRAPLPFFVYFPLRVPRRDYRQSFDFLDLSVNDCNARFWCTNFFRLFLP